LEAIIILGRRKQGKGYNFHVLFEGQKEDEATFRVSKSSLDKKYKSEIEAWMKEHPDAN